MSDNNSNQNEEQMNLSSLESKIISSNVYDPSAYVKASNQPSLQSSKILSTQAFLKQVDLRCEDHLNKLKEEVQATRFCSECRVLCCDSCVIEYHHTHIAAAKTKIDDYFRKQKTDLEELKSKINSSIKFKVNNEEINALIDSNEKTVKAFFNRRKNVLEEVKAKLDNVINEEEAVEKLFSNTIQFFYKEECYKKLERPLAENEELLSRIQAFLRDFENFSKTDKVNVLKNEQVKIFQTESEENTKQIKEETLKFKSKSKIVEKKIQEILKSMSFTEEFFNYEKIISEINTMQIESKKKINMLKYDDIVEEKVEEFSQPQKAFSAFENIPEKIKENPPIQNKNEMNNFGVLGGSNPILPNPSSNNNGKNYFDYSNNKPESSDNIGFTFAKDNIPANPLAQPKENEFSLAGQNLPGSNQPSFNPLNYISNPQPNSQPIINKPKELMDYDYFIAVKPKSDELIIFSIKTGFSSARVNLNDFQNPAESYFTTFPENSKYINLGSSILLTGGYINKTLTQNCYLILVSKNQRTEQFEVNVMPYGKMIEGRERHNIVFLEDRNSVIACSGFFNKGSEITNLDNGEWKSLGQMNEVRGNATIAYVNNRYIYVIGGYKVPEGRNAVGIYHGNCEYFDLNEQVAGWRMIDFGDNSLKLSAMGVVPLDTQSFLICGGFDGSQYRKEVYKVNAKEPEKPRIEPVNYPLPGCFIFLHNSFLKNGQFSVSLELGFNAIIMSLTNYRSQVQNYIKQ